MVKRQEEWIKRNAKPVYKHLSEYEKFENEFIKGRTERMNLPGHNSSHSVKDISKTKHKSKKSHKLQRISMANMRILNSKIVIQKEDKASQNQESSKEEQEKSRNNNVCVVNEAQKLKRLKSDSTIKKK